MIPEASLAEVESEEAVPSIAAPSQQASLSDLKSSVKLLIHNPQTGERLAFGPGVAGLCEGVRRFGSLSAAAKEMNMSYSKAWKIVGEAEEALRVKLVMRQKPKGFWLTPEGEALLDAYLEISEDITKYADYRFEQKFPKEDSL